LNAVSDLTLRSNALRRGLRLEYFTVVWMAAEAVLAIAAGIVARSVLLTAFGADSLIEVLSGVTLLWRLRTEAGGGDERQVDIIERRATWVSAALLILLSAYVVLTSAAGLLARVEPERSWLGLAVAAIAIVVMPWLAYRKGIVNRILKSSALRADIAETASCAYLAGVTLLGVSINAVTGWWWAEYIAAILLLRWLIPEAREALEAAREGRSAAEHE